MRKFKIKDDVDLKELEKHGFKKYQDWYIREYEVDDDWYYKKHYIRIRNIPGYWLYKEIQDCATDPIGFIHQNYKNIDVDKKVSDLILAGLVEIEGE